MEIQRKNLDVIFRRISSDRIFNSIRKDNEFGNGNAEISNTKISFRVFREFSNAVYTQYSENEIQNIYDVMNDDLMSELNGSKSIFNLLYKYGEKVLLTDDKFPVCRYEEILNWRELTNKLGQDIITTSYLAYYDLYHNEVTKVFSWRPVIKTDNIRLHKILDRGLAENHYHLNGSTQVFPLSWICIMNYFGLIDKISMLFKERLDGDVLAHTECGENSWGKQLKRAAAIRAYLFERIVMQKDKLTKDGTKYTENKLDIINALSDPIVFSHQERINSLKYTYAFRTEESNYVLDYALMNNLDEDNFNANRALVGERYFLYHCFRKIYSNIFDRWECDLFYLYLVIKSQFRGELVQINDRVGFKNFQNYQGRKGYITDLIPGYEEEVYNLALNATLEDQNIKSLEARIMPRDSAKKVRKSVEKIDKISKQTKLSSDVKKSKYSHVDYILEDMSVSEDEQRYCYILHFPKTSFKIEKDENSVFIGTCRHHMLRVDNKRRAKAVANALSNNYKLRKRIKGIDGCANEIGCRPETLATELRYLSNYNPIYTLSYDFQYKEPISLGVTYHVGEDFLDIVDGLRAIDEAIFYINLKRNDRLGHALALGIDVCDYYKSKNGKVIMPKQDLLDNLIWIQYKADLLNVKITQRLRNQMNSLIDELLIEIYKKFGDDNSVIISHELYIQAWMLRGDDPELYRAGKYVYKNEFNCQYLYYSKNPRVDDSIRNNRETTLLYYAYHFDYEVKKGGQEKYIFKPEADFIEIVTELQNKFQFEVAKKGIAIECNPSSNYLIGSFKRFEKHPIVKFYNNSLEIDSEKIRSSPQLSVSINTDDQGVFDTYLENEYALMASALERVINNEMNESEFSSARIYNWIDDIRHMGEEQSFL